MLRHLQAGSRAARTACTSSPALCNSLLCSLQPSASSSAQAPAQQQRRRALSSAAPPQRSLVDKDIIPDKVVQHPYTTGNYRYLPGFSFPAPRKLDQVVQLPLLERESPGRIREIWNEYHDARLDCVATVWSAEEMAATVERRMRCPRFVYPVLKGEGKYFALMAEWQDKFCIFSFLEDYKRNPSAAEPYLSVALHDEFLGRKGLVLVRGDFSGHLLKRDAAHLLNLMRHFYFQEPKWVETFNRDPGSFDWNSFVASCPPPPEKYAPQAGKLDRAKV